ncbi:hypothetical protein LCGC14_1821540 [marine sediment metagenome]|uniref:Leucine-rich repeat domain-containing protein n=1 Tax=marine sediment metagenome TaxID=412755 RepID=A0A0F9H6V6_9ZZZZ
MKEFVINEFIKLRLVDGITNIYVKGRLFNQCKFVLLNQRPDNIGQLQEINSVDDLESQLDDSLESEIFPEGIISPEMEFWVHSSNLQVWAESNYDTRFLHRNLAFPLLKEIAKTKDSLALRVFKEEIGKRFESGNPTVVNFLIEEKYHQFLSEEELLSSLLKQEDADAILEIEMYLKEHLNPIPQVRQELLLVPEVPRFEDGVIPYVALGNPFAFWVRETFNAYATRYRRVVKLKLTGFPDDFKFPECVSQLEALEELYIHNNQLTKLPEWVDLLNNLKLINIRGYEFDSEYLETVVRKFKEKGVKVVW